MMADCAGLRAALDALIAVTGDIDALVTMAQHRPRWDEYGDEYDSEIRGIVRRIEEARAAGIDALDSHADSCHISDGGRQ